MQWQDIRGWGCRRHIGDSRYDPSFQNEETGRFESELLLKHRKWRPRYRSRQAVGHCMPLFQLTASCCVAFMMKSATFSGCDTMGTWLDSSSMVVALIIFAVARSCPGSIIRSSVATMAQEGLFFQATLYTFCVVAEAAHGVCVATSSFRFAVGRSWAKASWR